MKSRFLLTFLALSILSGLVWAADGAPPARPILFSELWNNLAYYATNLESKNFSSILGRFEGKIGVNLFNTPLQAYGVYYATLAQTSNYFDNSLFAGAGLRFKPLESYQGHGWQDEWLRDVKIFAESLGASYFKGAASAEAAGLAKTDTRLGFDLWHEWNLDHPDEQIPWGELWANLSYRQTNFGWEDFTSYILYFQPKIGRHLGKGVEVYVRGDVTYAGKSGPSYYFLNTADYGVGIRFEPWRSAAEANDLFRKFKMFAEFLSVAYLKDKPTDPNKAVTSDVRFGVDFSNGR